MLDQRTREVVARLCELYAAGTDYESKQVVRPEINGLWNYLDQATTDAKFDDLLHIIKTVPNPRGQKTLELIDRALRLCESLEHIEAIIPFLPGNWIEEKAILLRKIVELTDDKQELLKILQKTGFIA